MSKAKYSCSQITFYAAAHEGADRLMENLDDFTPLFPEYTLLYAQGIKGRIDAADALPDQAARKLIAEIIKLEVDKLREENAYQFGLFLSTIDRICEPSLRETTYDAAGRKHYNDAKAGDSAKVIPMFSSLNEYIDTHWDALSTTGQMTADKRADFVTRQTHFKARYDAQSAAERSLGDQKDEKISANNDCFDELTAYTKLAQRIYANNAEMAKYFTFKSFRAEVESVKNAGLSGKITNVLNKDALKNVTITIKDYNKSFVTDKTGKFEISPLSAGKYTVIVECPGFETQTFDDVKIRTGVVTRLNVKMVAAAMAAGV